MSDARRPTQFDAFVVAYQDMVFATAVRLLGRAADAEDVAQTVFLKAWPPNIRPGTTKSQARSSSKSRRAHRFSDSF